MKTLISVPRGLSRAAVLSLLLAMGDPTPAEEPQGACLGGCWVCWSPQVSDTHLVQEKVGANTTYLFDGMSKEYLVAFSGACVHSFLLLFYLI